MTKMQYLDNCVSWPKHDVNAEGGLCDMIARAQEISRRTFLQRVSKASIQELEQALGYASHYRHGMTMAGDYHISYYRSKLHGRTVYFFKHSAIEYVFA